MGIRGFNTPSHSGCSFPGEGKDASDSLNGAFNPDWSRHSHPFREFMARIGSQLCADETATDDAFVTRFPRWDRDCSSLYAVHRSFSPIISIFQRVVFGNSQWLQIRKIDSWLNLLLSSWLRGWRKCGASSVYFHAGEESSPRCPKRTKQIYACFIKTSVIKRN